MILASKGIVPPSQWHHDPNIKNNWNYTVEDYLKDNNITVPNEWKVK